jgi:hypothetical protein
VSLGRAAQSGRGRCDYSFHYMGKLWKGDFFHRLSKGTVPNESAFLCGKQGLKKTSKAMGMTRWQQVGSRVAVRRTWAHVGCQNSVFNETTRAPPSP